MSWCCVACGDITWGPALGLDCDPLVGGQPRLDNPGPVNRYWVRRVTGKLETRDRDAVEYFDIAGPVQYDKLQPLA